MSEPVTVEILNYRGLHARASAKLVKCVEKFDASVTLTCHGRSAEALSIMDLLMLEGHKGTTISLEGTGPQAQEAMAAIVALIEDKFGEDG